MLATIAHLYPVEYERKINIPKDRDQALDLIDPVHQIWLLLLDGALHIAPAKTQGANVLDLCTGKGAWAKDFASLNCMTRVMGMDFIIPWRPPLWKPMNLVFCMQEVGSQWLLPKNAFDFIHGRTLGGEISNWTEHYEKVFEHLKPGGYYEDQELSFYLKSDDGSVRDDHIFHYWHDLQIAALERGTFDRTGTFTTLDARRQRMSAAGFQDIVVRRMKIPVGPWTTSLRLSDAGRWLRYYMEAESATHRVFGRLLRTFDWSEEDIDEFVDMYRKQLRNKSVHAYLECDVMFGRKPERAGQSRQNNMPRN
ncbi:hypothetical protein IWX49DRAFT_593302 [Phyllosticta citricarpa]|uniref:S-adenosyl-L-methionine-dependent methyltransferase n=2 Tax=Phyllosticta TaxID=121621 RepID=A0ABR1LVG7_9PEZI